MFAGGPVGVAVLALLVAVGVTAVIIAVRRPGIGVAASRSPVAREWRWVQLTRWCGIGAGLAAAVVVGNTGGYGTGLMLAPGAFGLCVLLATTIGETVIRPRRPATARSADLTARRVRDYLPRGLTTVVASMLQLTLATVVLTTVTASRDQDTGQLRSLACEADGFGSARSPYPGAFYTLPLGVALLVAVVVAGVAAVRVVQRPRGMAPTVDGDDGLRRRSLVVVVAATGVAVCGPQAGVSAVAGMALAGLSAQCAPGWMQPVGIVLAGVAAVSVVVTLTCLGRVLLGTPQRVAASHEPEGTRVR